MTPTSRMERAQELFVRALDLPEEERRAFLESACRDDESLRIEVLSLLEIDAGAERLSSSPGEGREWLARNLFPASMPPTPPPQTIGRFRVVRELGQGGMGVVYEVVQDAIARRAAVKIIHPGLFGPGALRRFQRESRAMAALTHPGIVQLFEVGMDSAGGSVPRPYLVMELVEGETLRHYLDTRAPSIAERLRLMVDLCEAVHHAHQKGIVHRDLKPENILVVPPGPDSSKTAATPQPQPKILDFGVSRLLEDDAAQTFSTRVGQVVGTAPYLSPEQAEGDALAADTRSDVYALGVIAFELLSGKLPFDVRGLTSTAAIRLVLDSQPARLRSVDPSLDQDLQTIVRKAMHRDPAGRYASAAEFGADIRRYLAHEPILARAPSWTYVGGRFIRRHRMLTTVVGASALLIATLVVAMVFAWSDARRTREAAVWQRYLSAMSAASVALAGGDIATARRELEATPPEHRGWEFRHLATRLDQSARCVRVDFKPPFVAADVPGMGLVLANSTGAAVYHDDKSAPTPLDARLHLWVAAHSSVFPGPMAWSDPKIFWPGTAGGLLNETTLKHWPDWSVDRVHEAKLNRSGSTIAMRVTGASHHTLIVGRLSDGEGFSLELLRDEQVAHIAISGDGRCVAVAKGGEGQIPSCVRVHDAADGHEICRTPTLPRAVTSMVLSPDGRELFAALQNGELHRWDLSAAPPKLLTQRVYDQDAPLNLSISPDGTLLVAGSRDGIVHLWNAATLESVADLVGHETEIHGAGFARTDGRAVTTGTDGTIRFWDRAPAPLGPLVLRGHTKLVHPLAISETRRQVITGSWDKTVAVYSLDTGDRRASVTLSNYVQLLALSPDERVLAVRQFQSPMELLDAVTLAPIRTIPKDHPGDVPPLFDTASRRVTVALEPWNGRAWAADLATGAVSSIPFTELRDFVGPTVSRKADLAAVSETRGGEFWTVFYRLSDGKEAFARRCRRIATESMAFAPDGKTLAVVGEGNTIELLDARTFRTLGVFRGHTREVLAMVFSPDGERFFSADFTGVIRIWDTRTTDEVGQLRGHENHVRRLAMSADGKRLVSGSRDGTARIWSVP